MSTSGNNNKRNSAPAVVVWAPSGKTQHLAIVVDQERKEDGMTLIQWESNGETALVPTVSIIPNSDMGRRGVRGRASRRGNAASSAAASSSTKPTRKTKKRVVERDDQNSNKKGKKSKSTAAASASAASAFPAATTPTTPKKQRAPPPRSSFSSSNKERGLPTSIQPKKKNAGKSTGDNIDDDITSMEIEVKEEEQVQPDTAPSSISTSNAAPPSPDPVSSSAAAAVPPTTVSVTNPRAAQAPVAFVERDFVVKEEEEEEEEQGGKEAGAAVQEIITSGDTTSTGARAQQQLPTTGGRVIIKHEQADNTNNNRKRRKQGSKDTIKSEELDNNNHDAYSTKRTRRGERNQCSSEENTTASSNDNANANTTKNRQVGGRNATNNVAPKKRRSLRNKHPPQEEDTNAEEEIINCCQFCNDPDWENRIYYKCGTVLSKYFPKSYNNPNPGWYKGTIWTHHISSSDHSSDSACEEEAEKASKDEKEESDQQSIIYNEIHYEDGDMENIAQDDLKLQLMDGDRVKILYATKMGAASNSESCNSVNVAPTATLSDNKYDLNWLQNFQRLNQFKAKEGHCRVPRGHPSLGNWVHNQRTCYKQNKLAEDRAEKLNKIGFAWDPFDQTWDEMFGRLKRFKAENGNCRVPRYYDSDPSFGRWVDNQRTCYKQNKLAEDRTEKLNKIGFDWDPFDQTWDEMFSRLEQFKEENGHCRVPPRNYGPDPALGIWVSNQRQHYKKGTLAPDRAEKLEEIDFEWDARTEIWDEMFGRLEQFKAKNGHCLVPAIYGPDPSLGLWVTRQRRQHKKGTLAADREQKLGEIHFEWNPFHQTWDEMFGRLEQFKDDNSHCRVPCKYDPDPSLGRWVSTQRQDHKKGRMALDRVKKLNKIGFEWKTRTGPIAQATNPQGGKRNSID